MNFIGNLRKDDRGILVDDDSHKVYYPSYGNELNLQLEEDGFWHEHRNRLIRQAVQKFKSDGEMFDIGGGNGYVAKGIQECGTKVVLVEPGYIGCQNAKKRGVQTVICSTIQKLEFEKQLMNNVGVFDVLEHIENDSEFLVEIGNKMEANGSLFITVPAYPLLWSAEDIEAGHFRRYSSKSLKLVLSQAGFKLNYSTYFFSVLILPIFLLRSLKHILGIRSVPSKKSHTKAHILNNPLLSFFLNRVWSLELWMLRKKFPIPIGSSLFVVARKKRKSL